MVVDQGVVQLSAVQVEPDCSCHVPSLHRNVAEPARPSTMLLTLRLPSCVVPATVAPQSCEPQVSSEVGQSAQGAEQVALVNDPERVPYEQVRVSPTQVPPHGSVAFW